MVLALGRCVAGGSTRESMGLGRGRGRAAWKACSSAYRSDAATGSSAVMMASTTKRSFSTTNAASAGKPRRQRIDDDPLNMDFMEKSNNDELTTFGHLVADKQREMLHYARLVEWELPKLAKMRKPYVVPSEDAILNLRSLHFQGQPHPVTRKAVLTVNVADVFKSGKLSSDDAKRKFILLAGIRWNPLERIPGAPAAGLSSELTRENRRDDEDWNKKEDVDINNDVPGLERVAVEKGVGHIKISCERFPFERQNMKWCSDVLDEMIKEANKSPEEMKDVPFDLRHVRARQQRRPTLARHNAPSIRDFPREWLSVD